MTPINLTIFRESPTLNPHYYTHLSPSAVGAELLRGGFEVAVLSVQSRGNQAVKSVLASGGGRERSVRSSCR